MRTAGLVCVHSEADCSWLAKGLHVRGHHWSPKRTSVLEEKRTNAFYLCFFLPARPSPFSAPSASANVKNKNLARTLMKLSGSVELLDFPP